MGGEIVAKQKLLLTPGAEESTYWKYVEYLRSPGTLVPHFCAEYYKLDVRVRLPSSLPRNFSAAANLLFSGKNHTLEKMA